MQNRADPTLLVALHFTTLILLVQPNSPAGHSELNKQRLGRQAVIYSLRTFSSVPLDAHHRVTWKLNTLQDVSLKACQEADVTEQAF